MGAISNTLRKQLSEARLRVFKLQEAYDTQRYLETMPDFDPLYQYCYSTSNFTIPYSEQSIDAWIRAIIVHMGGRKPGHGGEKTKAVVVSVPQFDNKEAAELWLDYVTKQLRVRVMPRGRTKKATA